MLKFYARDGQVSDPLRPRSIGSVAHYVGREPVKVEVGKQSNGEPLMSVGYPASKDAYEVDETSVAQDQINKLIRACTKGSLWPADKETALRCDVAFRELEFNDGAWSPKASKSRASEK